MKRGESYGIFYGDGNKRNEQFTVKAIIGGVWIKREGVNPRMMSIHYYDLLERSNLLRRLA